MESQIKTASPLFAILFLLFGISACTTVSKPKVAPPAIALPPVVTPPVSVKPEPTAPTLQISDWKALPGWQDDNQATAWEAFLQSCNGLKNQVAWQQVCKSGQQIQHPDSQSLRRFFEQNFTPYLATNPDGTSLGMITGYYEPVLRGSRTRTAKYRFPLYGAPGDLLNIELADVYPELKGLRLRGRIQGNKVVPYYSRAEIESAQSPLKGTAFLWVDDAIDLFFLHVQGSGRVKLENGESVRIGYANQNGFPYKSIGKVLVDRGELPLEKASAQVIKDWTLKNPGKMSELLNNNASYVFFREMPNHQNGPTGSLGVPLTAGRSIAVDPRSIPLGAPVFLSTTWPNSTKPLSRLVMAQDTGAAIKGGVRADFFWGFGNEAGALAGRMKQQGQLWVLLPKGYPVSTN